MSLFFQITWKDICHKLTGKFLGEYDKPNSPHHKKRCDHKSKQHTYTCKTRVDMMSLALRYPLRLIQRQKSKKMDVKPENSSFPEKSCTGHRERLKNNRRDY